MGQANRGPRTLVAAIALTAVFGFVGVACAQTPSPALLDAVKPDLAHLDAMKVSVDKNRIAIESGQFRLTDGRPILFWRPKGTAEWVETQAGELQKLDAAAGSQSYRVAFGDLSADITIRKFIGDRVWRFSGKLTNQGKEPVELARFHYADGNVPAGMNFLELIGPRELPILRTGQSDVAPRPDIEKFWAEMNVQWPRLSEPIHDQVGWFVSNDCAALVSKWNTPGLGFGFVAPGEAFGEIGYRGSPSGARVFFGVLLDNIVLDPGETRSLEEAIVWCGDWQSGLDLWARTAAAEMGARDCSSPLVGYCSWYRKFVKITPEDIDQATKDFTPWAMPRGGRTIQIDDGFQKLPGDWDPNDRFKDAWPGLAQRIADTGSIPGLWVAPTTVHESHPIVKEHPDWLQRMPNGEPAIYFSNWGRTYYLEPDHPEVRKFMRDIMQRFCKEGWRYFKIDFTYPVTAARVGYDRKKTTFQSLGDMYTLFREAVGPDVLLNVCAGQARYALGKADIARLGGDIGFHFGKVREDVHQLFGRTCTNGIWWQGDPDVFSMGHGDDIRLSAEEKRVLTGSIGLFGGAFLTSDVGSEWMPDEAAYVRQYWNQLGPRPPRQQRVIWTPDGKVIAYCVHIDDGRVPAYRVGLYNWTDAPADTQIRLADAHFPVEKLGLARNSAVAGATLKDGVITFPQQPAHSLRIIDLLEDK